MTEGIALDDPKKETLLAVARLTVNHGGVMLCGITSAVGRKKRVNTLAKQRVNTVSPTPYPTHDEALCFVASAPPPP
jgi:hypothetical protein